MSAPVLKVRNERVHPVDELLPVPKLATHGFGHVVPDLGADANPIAAGRFSRLNELQ